MRWKRWEIALAGSILAAILFCAFPAQAQSALADKLVRLHVLANSDSEEDQALKLQVRDAVLAASAGAAVLDDALLAQLQRAAQRTVHLSAVIAPALQLGLDGLHLLAGAALTVNGGVGACGQQDHQHDGRENSADPDPVLPIHMHIAPFSHRICAARGIMYSQE